MGYLLKDSSPQELVQAIRQVFRGRAIPGSIGRGESPLRNFHTSSETFDPVPLTAREMEILRLVAQGKSNKEIAGNLVIAEETVHTHVSNVLNKLHLASRTQAALYALKEGIASVDDIPEPKID